MLEALTLAVAAAFAGAALYVNVAEQPARLTLADEALVAEWRLSYARAAPMQAGLAMVGGVLGFAVWAMSGDWRWGLGAAVLLANWPFTLLAIRPVNDALKKAEPGAEIRPLVLRWGRLHAWRSALGLLATAIFVWAGA